MPRPETRQNAKNVCRATGIESRSPLHDIHDASGLCLRTTSTRKRPARQIARQAFEHSPQHPIGQGSLWIGVTHRVSEISTPLKPLQDYWAPAADSTFCGSVEGCVPASKERGASPPVLAPACNSMRRGLALSLLGIVSSSTPLL